MRSSTAQASTYASTETVAIPLRRHWTDRIADYVEISKPRISFFVLISVAAGFLLGGTGEFQVWTLANALLGIALVATGSSALNQYYERDTDARMERTNSRPIPSGRLSAGEVLTMGLVSGIVGCVYLALFVNLLTAALAAATYLAYTLIYTPLKRISTVNTAVGAVPGALPPVLGWTAAGGSLDFNAFMMFSILYLWQFPHFMAIAWLYRDDYRRAGLKMIPAVEDRKQVTGFVAVGYALALLPVSLLPGQMGLAGDIYFVVALVFGVIYLWTAVRFCKTESVHTARQLLLASLAYLPAVWLAMVGEHLHLLN
ncbi:Protoheme IX farnesyltransferase 1 [Symmachiella dynata]|uniref:heme o synthase n=1 Tax=Symmachiella dynata TaxID=2527995 RepID=UPI00118C5D79|nr:heme o synthase [Symmachiella dynata]QDT48087.1 Protoheme IX farnesyltransferase 1 [Symmachiella dynata]